ncbi:RNA polymerase subunit sigma-70 [Halioglobus japonicus]|uniref:RNA polymerase subunit sigma-70 n=1 Tax=Halioglobus japonicus TaxID=930805 RepID=A0AAP8MGY4_9GAMM|nr:sigma-70 family RNA polymerase sigma factor [Halioglobus japonicus]AQA19384.1 RNA polymerase subunit sigma-70 [Halioglobus japonicus]PLW87560.1 RNA polymerase subunit sigma-70 [Halioglobus japonicus]GHD07805.1 DNA-directed RNA polymerase sigma-70 factor [Halioglobus japonicus]
MPSLSDSQREALMAELGGLRRFCYSLTGNAADADDLLQGTVEKLLSKGIPEDAHTAKWSYRVCKNVWIDELRSREVRQRYPSIADEEEDARSTEAVAEGEQALDAVSRALEQLPEDQRLALTLVTVEGKSYAEAAEILEVPVGTIMSRIARARKNLLDIYSPPGAD